MRFIRFNEGAAKDLSSKYREVGNKSRDLRSTNRRVRGHPGQSNAKPFHSPKVRRGAERFTISDDEGSRELALFEARTRCERECFEQTF